LIDISTDDTQARKSFRRHPVNGKWKDDSGTIISIVPYRKIVLTLQHTNVVVVVIIVVVIVVVIVDVIVIVDSDVMIAM
jgi:hypothetical protein